MALNWSLKDIKDHENVCWIGEGDDSQMNPVTESLIFATISIGIPKISKENCTEVFARLTMLETIYGPPFQAKDGPASYTLEDVRKHIGLGTNATPFTKAKFHGNITRIMRERANAALRKAEESATANG